MKNHYQRARANTHSHNHFTATPPPSLPLPFLSPFLQFVLSLCFILLENRFCQTTFATILLAHNRILGMTRDRLVRYLSIAFCSLLFGQWPCMRFCFTVIRFVYTDMDFMISFRQMKCRSWTRDQDALKKRIEG